MSELKKLTDFGYRLRLVGALGLPFLMAACASDGARYAPPPPWSTAQQQYNQTFSQRPPVAGQAGNWGSQSNSGWSQPASQPWQNQNSDATGSIPQNSQQSAVLAQPLPPVARQSVVARPAAPKPQWTPPAAPPPQWQSPASESQAIAPLPAHPIPVRQPQIADSGQSVAVESGQTILTISRKYGVKPQDLMRLNGIERADQIVIGQQLKLPKGAKTQLPAAWNEPAVAPQFSRPAAHTVRAGETLSSIAAQYNLQPAALARFNNLGPSDRPRIGQKLALAAPVRPSHVAEQQAADHQPTATIAPPPPAEKKPLVEQPRKAVIATPVETPKTAATPEPAATPVAAKEEPRDEPDFRWPVRGRVIAKFGPQPNGGNVDGIKIAVPQGTPVHAAEAGTVVYAGSELKPYGNLILIRHAGGWVTAYAHNSEIAVKNGETVKRGQVVARAGQTGNVTQPQVHFEIRKGKTPVDPMEHLTGG